MYVILHSVIHFIIEVPCTANYQQINVLCSVAYYVSINCFVTSLKSTGGCVLSH